MQRFAGLNSIEGWNLTLQLSNNQEFVKNNQESLDGTCIYFYNNRVYEKNKDKDQ